MAQSLSDIIAEARGNISRVTERERRPPRATTITDMVNEARENIRRSLDSQVRVTPRFQLQKPEDLSVLRVIDGDTIDVDGLGPVRLTGLHAPETKHPRRGVERLGPESAQLASLMFLGKKVRVTPQAGDERDVYGRLLATVTLPDGRVANAELADALARFPAASGQHVRDARAALGTAVSAGIMRGLIYPIGSLVPELYESLSQEISTARTELQRFMQEPHVFEAMGRPSDTIQAVLAGAPSVVGEVIGGLAPGLGLFKAAQTTFRVGKAVTMADRTLRHFAATGAAGAGFGAAARLEDGESRFGRVARDAAIAGATEAVFLPLLRRAWRAEFGAHADAAVQELSLKQGISLAEAERKITEVRAGANPADFETAEEIVNLAKTVPEIKGSPTHVQATKALGLLDTVLPQENAIVDPHLPKEIALSFSLEVNGQRMPIRIPSRAAGTPPNQILEDIDGVVQTIVREMSVGRSIKIHAPAVQNLRQWEFFKNRLLNRGIRKAPEGRPLGSAPPGSVAETGVLPDVGAPVNVIEESGARVRAVVEEVGEPQTVDELVIHKTSMPATTARLQAAGMTGEEIRSLPELDLHVAALLATPGKLGRQQRVLRTARERLRQGAGLSAPENPEDFIHFSPKEAAENGLDFEQYVTALTQNVLTGGKLTERQARSFPYLAQLSRRVELNSLMSGVAEEVPVELGRVKLPVVDPESGEVAGIREATRRTIPEEGEIFHFEGGETTESVRRREFRAGLSQQIAQETDPARRAKLEALLVEEDPNKVVELSRALEVAPPATGRVKKAPPGHIVVRGPDGKNSLKHVSQVTVELPVRPGEVAPKKPFMAHPDGGDRHGLIHLGSDEVSIEPVGANTLPGESYFRSPLFTSVDPEKDWGRDIPFFMHQDGSATLSITPVQELVVEKQASFGHRVDFGPQDIVAARREKQVGGVRRSGAEVLGLTETPPPEFGRFPAGYVPRAIRGAPEVETRFRPTGTARPTTEFPDILNLPRARENPDLALDFETDDMFLIEGDAPTVRGKGRRRPGTLPVAPAELRGMEIRTGVPVKRKPGEGPLEYGLTRDALTGPAPHPEWATVRNAARVLLKQGYEPTAPLRIRIAREAHRGAPDSPTAMTIGEAANLELPLPNSDRLREEAAMRGITVLPKGAGVELHFPDGSKRPFRDDLEAMEAAMRVPVAKLDRPLEAELQRSWNMGLENGVDPEVDAATFAPIPLQEVLLNQVAKGTRPMAVVRTSDINEFNSAFDVLAQGTKKRIQVQTLEERADGTVRLAVFDPELVRARASQSREGLIRLGVNPDADPRLLVQDLDVLPRGTHIMEARDVESAMMYSWFRKNSMKGNWEEGHVLLDETGPHRVFADETKAKFTFRVCV